MMINYIETTNAEDNSPLIIYVDEIISCSGWGADKTEIKTRNGLIYALESVDNIGRKITTAKRKIKR